MPPGAIPGGETKGIKKMAAHSNDKSILGSGLQWNVRSYMLERRIDFGVTGALNTSNYYEIGTLPKGFVPRNIALVQLTNVNSASTVKVYKTVEDAENGSATEIASLSATASPNAPAAVYKPFDAIAVTQSSSSPYAVSAATVTPSTGAQLAIKVGAGFTKGVVKVVISGDWMTGYFDEALDGASDFNAADHVRKNIVTS